VTVYNLPSADDKDITKVAYAIRQIAQGRSNATGTVTLTANAATTAVSFVNCATTAVPILVPTTANAAAEIGNGTMYVSAVANGSFTITHANNAQVDRTFLFACIG
jgi:hypothetical protein